MTDRFTLHHADCRDAMAAMEANSVGAVVCDPPYGLSFMGKGWDHGVPGVTFWTAALRVLKPGGHLLAFGGTRTFHRLTVAIEDAGFEVRDCLSWMYGSGFPKSLDVSKAIDKAAGKEREVVGIKTFADGTSARATAGSSGIPESGAAGQAVVTAPATPEAERWQGWGTALKPAWEPIVVARKPLVGTVAANVLAHGTGAINVDATRIRGDGSHKRLGTIIKRTTVTGDDRAGAALGMYGAGAAFTPTNHDGGRWPANVILAHHEDCVEVGTRKVRGSRIEKPAEPTPDDRLVYEGGRRTASRPARGHGDPDGTETVPAFDCHSDCPVRLLDEQTGTLTSGKDNRRRKSHESVALRHLGTLDREEVSYGDSGGASRFFYNAKVSKRERNLGLPDSMRNTHPTCKPVAVMAWLCRLVTPPGGTVLDPFMGSGSTGVAALGEGFRFVGIDREAEYIDIARHRLDHAATSGRPAEVEHELPEPEAPHEDEWTIAQQQQTLFGEAAA